ncbi:hypothetical protein FQZ97_1015610 [compost metagenome]
MRLGEGAAGGDHLAGDALHLRAGDGRHCGLLEADVWVAAVVIHHVGAELGVVQLRHEPAQGDAVLPAVAGVVVREARFEGVALAGRDDADIAGVGPWIALREVRPGTHQSIVAALGDGIAAKEGAAVVDDAVVPLQLVEGFGGKVVG